MAVKQMKEQIELVESSGETRLHDDVTPTPYETNEKDLKRQIVHLQSAVNQVCKQLLHDDVTSTPTNEKDLKNSSFTINQWAVGFQA